MKNNAIKNLTVEQFCIQCEKNANGCRDVDCMLYELCDERTIKADQLKCDTMCRLCEYYDIDYDYNTCDNCPVELISKKLNEEYINLKEIDL